MRLSVQGTAIPAYHGLSFARPGPGLTSRIDEYRSALAGREKSVEGSAVWVPADRMGSSFGGNGLEHREVPLVDDMHNSRISDGDVEPRERRVVHDYVGLPEQ